MEKSKKIERIVDFVREKFEIWFDDVDEANRNGDYDFPLADTQTILKLSKLGDGSIYDDFMELSQEEKDFVLKKIKE